MLEVVGLNASPLTQTLVNEVKDAFKSPKAESVDFSGAITSKLAFIVMRFQTALENMAALGIKEQETVDARIRALSEVLNAVQKLEVGNFSKEDLDKVLDLSAVPPSMERAIADIKEQAKEKYDLAVAVAKLAERESCAKVEDWAYRKTSGFKSNYERMLKIIEPSEVVSTEDGMLRYWGVARSTGETAYINIPIHGTLFYPTWATDTLKAAYKAKQAALAKADTEYKKATSGVTLHVALFGLRICTKDEDLPTSKAGLKVTSTKISDMISSLESVQATITSDVSGINNNAQQQITKISEMLADYFSVIQKLIESTR